MAPQQRNRLSSSVIAEDRKVLQAIQDIDGYTPHNLVHATAELVLRDDVLRQAEIAVERAVLALDAARTRQHTAAWDLHDSLQGAKEEIIGQFGSDSQIMHAIGYKKRSEHKRPKSRQPAVSA